MEGAALAEKKLFDLAIITAWHTEAFARSKRLPKLDKLLTVEKPPNKNAQAIAFFHRLKAKGVPMEITRH